MAAGSSSNSTRIVRLLARKVYISESVCGKVRVLAEGKVDLYQLNMDWRAWDPRGGFSKIARDEAWSE